MGTAALHLWREKDWSAVARIKKASIMMTTRSARGYSTYVPRRVGCQNDDDACQHQFHHARIFEITVAMIWIYRTEFLGPKVYLNLVL